MVSLVLFCHTTVTCLSPGTRKNDGGAGACGVTNLASANAWAKWALLSNEPGQVVTSFSSMTPSAFTSDCVTQPATRSLSRTFVESAAIESPGDGNPGFRSP